MKISPTRELAQAITDISERMLQQFDSATPRLGLSLMKAEHIELIEDHAFRLADEWVVRQFASELSGRASRKTPTDQLALPGIGEIDRVITVSDGEGGFAYKRIEKATVADLLEDEDLMRRNSEAATKAYERARLRNSVLIPTMETHEFESVAEALAFLGEAA